MAKRSATSSTLDFEVPQHETALVGCCLMNSNIPRKLLSEGIHPQMFTDQLMRQMITVLLTMARQEQSIDLITFTMRFKKEYPAVENAAFHISATTNIVDNIANIHQYIFIVKTEYIQREYKKLLTKMYQQVIEDASVDPLLQSQLLKSNVESLVQSSFAASETDHIEVAMEELDAEVQRKLAGEKSAFLSTGFNQIDAITNGLNPTDLFIIAARPGMGKTAFMLSVAQYVAKAGNPIVIISLEMSRKDLVSRLISREAKINSQMIKNPLGMSTEDMADYIKAKEIIKSLPIYIYDNARTTVEQAYQIASQVKNKYKDKQLTVIIDYLQLMEASDKRVNREGQIAHMSRELKIIGKELNACVLALSQLSRSVEARSSKKPVLSDLRESGAIEQDADIVAFLFRPYYYGIESDDKGNDLTNILQVIFGKNRHGALNTQFTFFDDKTASVWPSNIKKTIIVQPDKDSSIYGQDDSTDEYDDNITPF